MNDQALIALHKSLRAKGFSGKIAELRTLIDQAEGDASKNRVLAWWKD